MVGGHLAQMLHGGSWRGELVSGAGRLPGEEMDTAELLASSPQQKQSCFPSASVGAVPLGLGALASLEPGFPARREGPGVDTGRQAGNAVLVSRPVAQVGRK